MRSVLWSIILIVPLILFSADRNKLQTVYEIYKKYIIQPDGRVVDWYNNGVTHSEGIGYTLFFAVSLNDKKTFFKVFNWFLNNMGLNKYGLVPWLWGKRPNGSWGILDFNDASDGDIWIAYSLLLGYEKWKEPLLKRLALKLIHSIRKYDIFTCKDKILLKPGNFGFLFPKYIRINPSYYTPWIFEKFIEYDPSTVWISLSKQSFFIFKHYVDTDLKLPADWVDISLNQCKPLTFYGTFGFNAIRVPIWIYAYFKHGNIKENFLVAKDLSEHYEYLAQNIAAICQFSSIDTSWCNKFVNLSLANFGGSYPPIEKWDYRNYYFLALYLMNLIFQHQ
jgi:endoglucanase